MIGHQSRALRWEPPTGGASVERFSADGRPLTPDPNDLGARWEFAVPYPDGSRLRNVLGGTAIVMALVSLLVSGQLGPAGGVGLLGVGFSIGGLFMSRRPKGAAVLGFVLSLLAVFVALRHAVLH